MTEKIKANRVSAINRFFPNIFSLLFSLFFILEAVFWLMPANRILILAGLAASVFLISLREKNLWLPSIEWLRPIVFFFLLLAGNSVLNGANLLENRWIERFIYFFLTLGFLQQFVKNKADFLNRLKWPMFLFFFAAIIYSLYQYFFVFLNNSMSHSAHASFFSNINMYTQAMSLGLPLIYLVRAYDSKISRLNIWIYDMLTVLMSTTLILGFCRSSWLALLAFYLMELYSPTHNSRKKTFCLAASSLILFFALSFFNSQQDQSLANKGKTASYRLALWQKSYQMAVEQPTGVGTDKFTFELQLYNNGPAQGDNLTDLFRSPHNEFLRLLAEEGWVVFILYSLATLIALLAAMKAVLIHRSTSQLPRFFICLIPEMFFQFPSEIWFSIFLMSLFAAYALSYHVQSYRWAVAAKTLLGAAALLTFTTYLIREKKIIPYQYSAQYCKVFPDNWPMCRRYFEDHKRDNNKIAASETVRPVLKRQPTNYIALAYDYSIGVEPRSQIIACLYYNLFYGKRFMHEEDKDICQLETDRGKLRLILKDFAEMR